MTSGVKRNNAPTPTTPIPQVYWKCSQVSYSFRPEQIVVGLRVAMCEHAMREYPASDMPKTSRFHTGRVARIVGEMMCIEFDNPAESGFISTTCGIKEYACFCIPVVDKPVEKPKRSKVKK